MTRPAFRPPAAPTLATLSLCLALGALSCATSRAPAGSAPAPPAEPPPDDVAAEPAGGAEPAPPSNEPLANAPPSTPAAAPAEPPDARGKQQIQSVIAANRERVRSCYDAAQKKEPGIQGDLVVSFVVNPDGSVKNAEVNAQESEIHSPELDSCAIEVLKSLKFPASSRGLESKVNYPFNFKPSAR